jgi:hypothetical protein
LLSAEVLQDSIDVCFLFWVVLVVELKQLLPRYAAAEAAASFALALALALACTLALALAPAAFAAAWGGRGRAAESRGSTPSLTPSIHSPPSLLLELGTFSFTGSRKGRLELGERESAEAEAAVGIFNSCILADLNFLRLALCLSDLNFSSPRTTGLS